MLNSYILSIHNQIFMFQLKTPQDVIGQIKSIINRANGNSQQPRNSSDPRRNSYLKCFVPIITEMIHLCATLGSNSKQCWLEACQNLVSDEEFVSDIDFCMKKGTFNNAMIKTVMWITFRNHSNVDC